MCTISMIPANGRRGARLIMNRDERRTRSMAWPPVRRDIDGAAFVAPTDSQAKGTWIAATSRGIVYALMNATFAKPLLPTATTISRGHVIPALVSAKTLDQATRTLGAIDLRHVAPFRLVAIDDDSLMVWAWDTCTLRANQQGLVSPRLFASSSIGDDVVEPARCALFERLLAQDVDPWRAQDRLHVHTWPDRAHLSVNMSRTDACTVNRTMVIVGDNWIEMRYAPFIEGWPGPVSDLALARAGAAAAAVA